MSVTTGRTGDVDHVRELAAAGPGGERWEVYTVLADSRTFAAASDAEPACCTQQATAEQATGACC